MIYLDKQKLLRKKLLSLYYEANVGHIASSLSCIDLLIGLFENKKINERILLSKGHAAASLYILLNNIGEINDETLTTFCENGTQLSAHPSANNFENIPFSTGSLGHGFPIGNGISLSNKLQKNDDFTYVIMSDGETNEGSVWEAGHFAVANKLDNLLVVIDKNNLQAFGKTSDVLGETAQVEKWKNIGFEVVEIDGHNLENLISTIQNLKSNKNGQPKMIIANTIKGKGVSFMENKLEWHYLSMNEEQYEEALSSIEENYHA